MHPRPAQRSRTSILTAGMALLIAGMTPVAPALAADPVEVVFNSTGAEQQWTVPSGVSSIHVVLIGAKGAGGGGNPGGLGHAVSGDLEVTPDSTLYIEVGGNGVGGSPGFNGGGQAGMDPTGGAGAGGGASDIRSLSRESAGTLGSRLMVAGGGGGVGRQSRGGDAGEQGAGEAQGGSPGTATGGGAGGIGDIQGSAGTSGVGGTGGTWCGFDVCGSGNAGGGGGGGYYGGGGGAGSSGEEGVFPSGGGGGGSAFTGSAANASVSVETELDASITITYTADQQPPDPTPGSDSGVVDADVTVPSSAACIELSETDVSFGTQRFGTDDVAADAIVVTNCSGVTANLFARGTDASGNGATWHLVKDGTTCADDTRATDDFHLKLGVPARPDTPIQLTESNTALPYQLGGGLSDEYQPLLDMPCPGSSGAGQTMAMQIVFVVTEAE